MRKSVRGFIVWGTLACTASGAAWGALSPAQDRQYGGVFSSACGNRAVPMLRLFGDVMDVVQADRTVNASRLRSSRTHPLGAGQPDFKEAITGNVRGGDTMTFVLFHNAQGLFAVVEAGPKTRAMLPAAALGSRIRHCDPNRNALPGAPAPMALPSPPQLLKDPAFRKPYLAALGPMAREPWLRELTGPAPESRQVSVAGTTYLMASVCKPHDCYDHNLVLLYDAPRGVVFGKLNQAQRGMLLGQPTPAVAAELERLWRGQFRR